MLVRLLLGFAIALFLTYPATVLTAVIEGQSPQAIYGLHLPTSIFSYLLISLPFLPLLRKIQLKRPLLVLLCILFVYAVLVFGNLGRADILNDDYDLAYQAYNLQDGIIAARKAFVISFNTHPPLFMSIKHYWFNILFPNGLETIPSWGYRGMEGLMGLATILAVYALTRSRLATILLAVNNYMIFLGRVYLREMYLTFFMTLSIYFFQKKNYLITAFLVACGLLIKTSAIVVLPVYLLILIYRKEYKNIFKLLSVIFIIYSPVVIYNLLAFVTTGRMDATFSKIFGLAHPFLTGSGSPNTNLTLALSYLQDIYSLPVLIAFGVVTIINFRSIYFLFILSSVLYFVFGGPLREYYLLFLTVPFVILAARLPKAAVILLVIISLSYAISGNSVARKLYEPSRGWPELVDSVHKVYKVGDCLEKNGGVNDLAMRAYFQTDDAVKAALTGHDYSHYYKMCDEVTDPANKIKIYYNLEGRADYQIL